MIRIENKEIRKKEYFTLTHIRVYDLTSLRISTSLIKKSAPLQKSFNFNLKSIKKKKFIITIHLED